MKNVSLPITLVIWIITCFQATSQLNIVYAVNCGGGAHTDSNGISYENDQNTDGIPYKWNPTFTGINDHDRQLYQTARYTFSSFGYSLPLTGDGWYGLLLHLADDSSPTLHFRRFKVTLNDQHTLLEDINLYKECGEYNICNQIFYFKVCRNTLHFANQTSKLYDAKKVDVKFHMHNINAIINGILLVKGEPGEGLPVVGTKTVIYFNPKNEKHCDGSPFINQCETNLLIWAYKR
jgi:Malectin domain